MTNREEDPSKNLGKKNSVFPNNDQSKNQYQNAVFSARQEGFELNLFQHDDDDTGDDTEFQFGKKFY